MSIIQTILGLGASVVMPIIITILGMILHLKFSKAFRAGMTIGIGFIGINLVVGLLSGTIGPAATAMTQNFGLSLHVVDVGWSVSSAIAFGTTIVPFVFVACFVINLIMLFTNTTKTLNIDVWNYWHFIFTGALVQYLTGNIWLGVLAACIAFVIIMKFADFTAPIVQKHFDLPGISLPHTESVSWAPIGIGLNMLIDKIPFINKINISGEGIQKRFGILGEPMVLGLILGSGIAAMAGYPIDKVIIVGVTMSAIMFLLPRMVRILMEGLLPLSDAAKAFMAKRFPGKEIYIGLDAAIAVGDPDVITTSLVMIPITILLAVMLPGNKMLPLVDLATIPFFMIWATIPSKGNLFRSIIVGTVFMVGILYIGTSLSPVITTMAQDVGFNFPKGASMISSLDAGAHLIPYLIYKIVSFFAGIF
ncbi:MAG: PTS transporter subunit IIC [Erysipelotrichaceae bacterium]